MIPIRPDAPGACGARAASCSCAPFLGSSAVTAEPRPAWIASSGVNAERGGGLGADLKFRHLTTNDGLSQGYVVDVLQDRRGFMWFGTREGLNRYDGYTFVVYRHDPNDPGSLSSSFIHDLMEDDDGYLWVATNKGVNRFDPTTERCIRYLHDPDNRDTLAGGSTKSVAQDRHGFLWFGTEDSGLDKLDPGAERSLITGTTATGGSSGGSPRSSRTATGTSGSPASAACSTSTSRLGESRAVVPPSTPSAQTACTKTKPAICGSWRIRRSWGS